MRNSEIMRNGVLCSHTLHSESVDSHDGVKGAIVNSTAGLRAGGFRDIAQSTYGSK
jgi:hypothetical protein